MQRQSLGEPIDKAPYVRETRYWSSWIVLTAIGQQLKFSVKVHRQKRKNKWYTFAEFTSKGTLTLEK
jgi:hypothetical protein